MKNKKTIKKPAKQLKPKVKLEFYHDKMMVRKPLHGEYLVN